MNSLNIMKYLTIKVCFINKQLFWEKDSESHTIVENLDFDCKIC